MPLYTYRAYDIRGKRIEGSIEAPSLSSALSRLKQKNLYVEKIEEDILKKEKERFPILSKLLYRISRRDIALFIRQLGTLLGAGFPLDKALDAILWQIHNPHLKKVIAEMKLHITEGKSLSQAFKEERHIFPPIYEHMIRVGEATGSYEAVCKRLADLEEKNLEIKNKAITALIYPSIMFIISIGVILFLLTVVVPQIELLFSTFKGELPWITRAVLFISRILETGWIWFLFLLGGGIYALMRYRRNPEGEKKIDRLFLRIPFFGKLLQKVYLVRFGENLSTLLYAGVHLPEALEITAHLVGNAQFKEEILKALELISEGASLREAFSSSEVLLPSVKGMIAAGEATDQLPQMLAKSAEILSSEVDAEVRRLTNSIEPVMILLMGIIVGGIMLSVMLPIYKMSEIIR